MNGHANIDTVEATEHLKNILNVGKSDSDSVKLKPVSNGSDMEGTRDDSYQKINLCANKDSSHLPIHGTDVDIYSSRLEFGATCSQVIVEDMVDYGWEEKYYHGRLISIHLSGLYIAYVLKPVNKPGFVRIWRTQLDLRYLIKEFSSEVKDLAFAHTTQQVVLGTVDACGELFVHRITDNGNVILCDLLLHITRPQSWTPSDHNRLIWCLYIPDDSEEDEADAVMALVVTHNERAEIWNVDTVIKEHETGDLTLDEVKVGVQVISDHRTPISAATFSPDGTALAIASTEGVVKFFQVNILEKDISPRCLHQWVPHPDKSLSSLYFLDNHKNHRPDVQFWKIAVTGADNNRELKVWSCESWTCLQTVRIHPNPNDAEPPCFKAEIDLSSKYLFLSDIKRKVLLILYLQHDPVPSNVVVCSVSEYRVPLPVLSLAISSISEHSASDEKLSDEEGDKDQEGEEDRDDSIHKYMIKLFWIQTKSLQSCRIVYKPKLSAIQPVGSVASLSHDSFVFKDGLSDLSLDVSTCSNKESTPPVHLYPKCSEVLLTPDDFTCSKEPRRKSSQHSANSSPSREVAEILAPAKPLHLDEMLPETSADITKEEPAESYGNQPDFMKEWPPKPSSDFIMSEQTLDELHERKRFSTGEGEPAMTSALSELNGHFSTVSGKLEALAQAFQEQRCEIQALQGEVRMLRQEQKDGQQLGKLEHACTQNYSRLESLILKKAEDERRKSDQNFNVLSEELAETFGSKLENTLKREMASTVIPQVNRVLDAIGQKMQLDLNQKLSATDSSLRDSFMKYVKGKGFQDGISQALSSSLQGSVQAACRDVFQSSVVPSFEKSMQHLFQQMNDQFSRGTHEYMQFVEKHGQKSSTALESSIQSFREEVSKCTSGINQAAKAVDTNRHHDALLSEIRHTVQQEMKKAFREQTNAVLNSRSTTPVPTSSDPQVQKQHLMQLVKQGSVNEAFQQALSAIDVQLVVFLCESVNPDLVFGPTPCPLQQHVLLSLLHQLSSDLFSKTDLKVRYIEDVMASLDSNDPIIKEHVRGVLNDLLQRISQFLQQNPAHRLSRNFKRISLAANALMKR